MFHQYPDPRNTRTRRDQRTLLKFKFELSRRKQRRQRQQLAKNQLRPMVSSSRWKSGTDVPLVKSHFIVPVRSTCSAYCHSINRTKVDYVCLSFRLVSVYIQTTGKLPFSCYSLGFSSLDYFSSPVRVQQCKSFHSLSKSLLT